MSAQGLKVLLVDDDRNIRRTLELSLKELDCQVQAADGLVGAEAGLAQGGWDLVLTDMRLEAGSGLDVIKAMARLDPQALAVVMTAYASFENAVEAVKTGAYDYLAKPFSTEQLEHLLSKIRVLVELRRENRRLREKVGRSDLFAGLLSPAAKRMEEFARKAAAAEQDLFLAGEAGTGRTEMARAIHARSSRAQGPLVILPTSALPPEAAEAEIFGDPLGRAGALAQAMGGTLYLDEVAAFPAALQARLLLLLKDRSYQGPQGVGLKADLRLITSSTQDLPALVEAGAFSKDLYFRLTALDCAMVALRHRREDIPVLAQRFLEEASRLRGRVKALRLSPEARLAFDAYAWPGNVRELRNVAERLSLLCAKDQAEVEDLPPALRAPAPARPEGPLRSLEELEREHIGRVLAAEPNQERAANILGITTVTLWRKRKQYGLP